MFIFRHSQSVSFRGHTPEGTLLHPPSPSVADHFVITNGTSVVFFSSLASHCHLKLFITFFFTSMFTFSPHLCNSSVICFIIYLIGLLIYSSLTYLLFVHLGLTLSLKTLLYFILHCLLFHRIWELVASSVLIYFTHLFTLPLLIYFYLIIPNTIT